jgi:polar amino acid transport system permease protein
MTWDWDFAWEILPEILDAFVITVEATLVGSAIAIVLGAVLALLRRSRLAPVRWVTATFVEFVRSTPLLVQLYFLFFVLPGIGITLSAFVTGVIGLGIHYATYMSEVYRAGIDAVPHQQWETARALNFSRRDTWARIISPQALVPIVPALGNYVILMFKDTPILSAITVVDALGRARIIGAEDFRYTEGFTIVGILFLIVSYLSALIFRWVEKRVNYNVR